MKGRLHLARQSLAILLSFLIGIGPISPTWGSKKGQKELDQDTGMIQKKLSKKPIQQATQVRRKNLKKEGLEEKEQKELDQGLGKQKKPSAKTKKSSSKTLRKSSKKEQLEEKNPVASPSFTNPTQSGKLEAYSCLDVDYKEIQLKSPGLHTSYIIGPIIEDGNCFIHAAFTKGGQTIEQMTELSGALRSGLPELVMSNDRYKNIMRYEILADCQTDFEKYNKNNELKVLCKKISTNTSFEQRKEKMEVYLADTLSQKKYKKFYNELSEDELEDMQGKASAALPEELKGATPHSNQELLEAIPDNVIGNYVKRYVNNEGDPDAYIEIPSATNYPSSIADVIALENNILIHCFLYDPKSRKLNYKTSLGDLKSQNIRSILHNGSHYWALYNQNDSSERRNGVIQAANNYKLYIEQFALGNAKPKAIAQPQQNHSTTASSSTLEGITELEDPFFWQVGQHYKKLSETVEKLSQLQLEENVKKIIRVINAHLDYFDRIQENLLFNLKSGIYERLTSDILTLPRFLDEQQPNSESMSASGDSDEDSWRKDFQRGYDRSSDSNGDDDESCSDSNSNNHEIDNDDKYYNSEEEVEELEKNFAAWQLKTLFKQFCIDVKNIDDFKLEDLDINHVHTFLTQDVELGLPSTIINDIVEGSYETSDAFIEIYEEEFGIEKKLLNTIFGGLWFDYDWEVFDIRKSHFIAKTYINTLNQFLYGTAGKAIKQEINETFKRLFFYNADNFENPLSELRIQYNKYAKNHDWKNALVVWSVYSVYRKIFFQKEQEKKVESDLQLLQTTHKFNTDTYLLKKLREALSRAQQYYTKVYPHTDTSSVIYSSRKRLDKTATLDLKEALSELKFVGQAIEQHRPKNQEKKNILVPRLYFVISDQPHDKGQSNHKRIFIPIELDLEFPGQPLTSHPSDIVFTTEKSKKAAYDQQAKQDYVKGQEIRGLSTEEANKIFAKATDRELIHSERVWLELLRKELFSDFIIEKLVSTLKEQFPEGYEGKIKVYSILALLYSTNSVCAYCTPSLIASQNSYEEGGFLFKLTQKLNQSLKFKCRGYNEITKQQNPAKFRLNTIVSATTNFDSEAHDFTAQGQHNHTTIGKTQPPKTHNPHGRLIFPNDAIDLHKEPVGEDGELDPQQRYFYEFVGRDLHKDKKINLPYPGVVFSSAGNPWSVPKGILEKTTDFSSK